jgi:serine/threonine protein kinase
MDVIREATDTGGIIEFPRQFGKYNYLRTLGSATNSVIVLAEDRSSQRFAVKIVSRTFLVSHGQLECFERELRLLQFIQHPNIVRLLDVVYGTDTIALVMEYCENGDLFEYLWHHGPIAPPLCRSYIVQILKALENFHEKGYAHRDLKPENILIDSRSRVKICDLGLARAPGTDGMMQTICGTMPYTPPEILQGLPYEGPRADIWSLGILIFVMATGRLPWESDDKAGMAREIVHGMLNFPNDFPSEIKMVVMLCTAINPADRPTAADLLELPWIAEELSEYQKVFGNMVRAPAAGGDGKGFAGLRGTPSARQIGKLLLKKPSLRSLSDDRLRQGGMNKQSSLRLD